MDEIDALFYYYPLPKKKPPISPSPNPSGSQTTTDTTTTATATTTSNPFPIIHNPIGIKEQDLLFYYYPFPKHESPICSSLNPQPTTKKSSPKSNNMDCHLLHAALACRDTLLVIFQKLKASDLARASCVCRLWRDMASDDVIVKNAFMEPWKLKEVVGKPVSGSFWRDNGICKFAISHMIVRGDSVASLAVKYSVQVRDIRRLNNMMSDHGIYSRERLLIPIINPNLLINSTCYIELDTHARREVAVLYPEGKPEKEIITSKGSSSSDHGRRRVIDSLKRSMQVDDETARYYWSVSNGDPRAALTEFSSDLRWERTAGSS